MNSFYQDIIIIQELKDSLKLLIKKNYVFVLSIK